MHLECDLFFVLILMIIFVQKVLFFEEVHNYGHMFLKCRLQQKVDQVILDLLPWVNYRADDQIR